MNEYNIGYAIGLLISIAIGLALGIILLIVCNKNKKIKTDYDEREKAIRGQGYKYAMITTWILISVIIFADLSSIKIPMDNVATLISVIMISVLVSQSYSILNDAYFGRNSNIKSYVITFIALAIINGGLALIMIMSGEMIVDGILTWKVMSLECALMFLIIGIMFAIKTLLHKKDDILEED